MQRVKEIGQKNEPTVLHILRTTQFKFFNPCQGCSKFRGVFRCMRPPNVTFCQNFNLISGKFLRENNI